jgi:hypothetical protein
MPRFDRTGPQGQGPQTGRGAGRCAGATNFTPLANGLGRGRGQSGGQGRGQGGGQGRGQGGGRGWRNCFFATGLPGWLRWGQGAAPATTDRDAEIAQLRAQIADANARLAALEPKDRSS